MSPRTQRSLRVLALGAPLRAYAASLQSDVNAAFMLVHHALAGAFASRAEEPPPRQMEAQLRNDLDRLHAGDLKTAAKTDRSPDHDQF